MEQHATVFTGSKGQAVPLQDMQIDARLRGPMAEVCVTQIWRNSGSKAIEGVYTFPLPHEAVLLGFDVVLAGQALKGRVVRSAAAEREYEEALEAGDSAIRLEEAEPGLYTVHVGNLGPGETARFRFQYTLLYRWSGDRLRLSLPTTVAPRYNDPLRGPGALQHSLVVENQFGLTLRLEGELATASIDCPTHRLQSRLEGDTLLLELQQPRMAMDRDLILNLRAPQAPRSSLLTGRDGSGCGAIASFMPVIPGLRQAQPLDIALVIDCSGSMAGTSIEQAALALQRMLATLQPTDRATLLRYGSAVYPEYPRTQACTPEVLARLRATCEGLQADLGGTSTHEALRMAADSGARDIFLVTDGEVGHWQSIVDEMRARSVRVFSVGVGMAIAESFLRQLSEATGGACEAVNPNEDMADRLLRHFQRLRAPAATEVVVHWPSAPTHSAPSRCRALFEGDTLIASALFDALPNGGDVVLEFRTADGGTHRQTLPWQTPTASEDDGASAVARLAANRILRPHTPHDRFGEAEDWRDFEARWTDFAERYQLISPLTGMIVVAERAANARLLGIPELQVVPQTLAAGYGGMGALCVSESASVHASFSASYSASHERVARSIEAPRLPRPAPPALHALELTVQRALFGPKLLRLLQRELHLWSPATALDSLERMLGRKHSRRLMRDVKASGLQPWIVVELLLEALITHLQPDLSQLDALATLRLQELRSRNVEHREALKLLDALDKLSREDENDLYSTEAVLTQGASSLLQSLLPMAAELYRANEGLDAQRLEPWLIALDAA